MSVPRQESTIEPNNNDAVSNNVIEDISREIAFPFDGMPSGTAVGAECDTHSYKSLRNGGEDTFHVPKTLIGYVGKDKISKEYNAMSNHRAGGTVHIGVREEGKGWIIEDGIDLTVKQQDIIESTIKNALHGFDPPLREGFKVRFPSVGEGKTVRIDIVFDGSRGNIRRAKDGFYYGRSGGDVYRLTHNEVEQRIKATVPRQPFEVEQRHRIEASLDALAIRDVRKFMVDVNEAYEKKEQLLGLLDQMASVIDFDRHPHNLFVAHEVLDVLDHISQWTQHDLPITVIRCLASYFTNTVLCIVDRASEQGDTNLMEQAFGIAFNITYDAIKCRSDPDILQVGAGMLLSVMHAMWEYNIVSTKVTSRFEQLVQMEAAFTLGRSGKTVAWYLQIIYEMSQLRIHSDERFKRERKLVDADLSWG